MPKCWSSDTTRFISLRHLHGGGSTVCIVQTGIAAAAVNEDLCAIDHLRKSGDDLSLWLVWRS